MATAGLAGSTVGQRGECSPGLALAETADP
jgi:hypothetical protein